MHPVVDGRSRAPTTATTCTRPGCSTTRRRGAAPSILVAGDGERRTLALAARFADACSLRPTPEIPHKLDVLRRHCEAAGTDPDRIEVTVGYAFTADDGGPATRELLDQLRWLAGLGVDTVIGRVEGLERRTPIEQLARHVVPAAAEL